MKKMTVGTCAILLTVGLIGIANSWQQQEGIAVSGSRSQSAPAGIISSQDSVNISSQDTVRTTNGYSVVSGMGETSYNVYAPMNSEVAQAIKKLKEAESSAEEGEAEDQLRKALEKDYDARLAAYEKNLDQLEAKLREMRKQLDRRRDAKEDMVSLRLQVLKAEADDLGWPSQMPGGMNSPFNYAPQGLYSSPSTGGR